MALVLEPRKTGISLAIVFGLAYIACAVLFAIIPAAALNFFANLFHGIDITQITKSSVPLSNTLLGLVESIVLAYLAGWVFAVAYNKVK